MPTFLRLTMPAPEPHTPKRPIAVNVNHIVTVTPRYVVHPNDKLKPIGQRRMIVEGTYVETLAHAGAGESSTFHVLEDFETVMGGIPVHDSAEEA